ncbi:MAG: hypothetical protein QGG36_19845 [Pirellulaceae bacterium]|jgi:hypothetical protein|nr:hypothetical protein [Pirellulaceae bacterium]
MDMIKQIDEQLRLIAAKDGKDAHVLTLDAAGGRLRCELAAVDSIGCAAREIEWRTDALAGAGVDRLRAIADQLVARTTYLLESLEVLEIDRERAVLQLRSSKPDQRDGARMYYEVVVEAGGAIHLHRYQKTPGEPRSAVEFFMTREVLGRIAVDMAETSTALA